MSRPTSLDELNVFPGASSLPPRAGWGIAVLEAIAGSIMVVVSLGAMAASIGNYSVWVWIATAVVGGLQCILIAQLAARFHWRSGGTPQYAYRAAARGSPRLGALSGWCYWIAWTPSVPVNLILASIYIRALVWPHVNVLLLAVSIGVVLYVLTALGLRLTSLVNVCLAALTVCVIVAIVITPIVRPASFSVARVFATVLPAGVATGFSGIVLLLLKWGFVATWTSYAPELSASLTPEIRDPQRNLKRVMTWSAAICVASFSLLPIALFGVFGSSGIQADPFTVFSKMGATLIGPAGQTILGVGLIIVLIFAAEAFIIGSSRTIYQMSVDGYLPAVFAKVNRFGAPVGSIVWDASLISIMIVAFGVNVVNEIAAANYGYLLVFVLMPLAYLQLRPYGLGPGTGTRRRWFNALAVGLLIFNLILLVVGGLQWGARVVTIGVLITVVILPVSHLTWRSRSKRAAFALDGLGGGTVSTAGGDN